MAKRTPLPHLIALTALALGACAAAWAQEEAAPATEDAPDAAELRAAKAWDALPQQLREVLSSMEAANDAVEDVTARVSYERAIPLLEEREKSRGTLRFRKPNLIALILKKPRNEEVHGDGKHWWIVSHNDKEVQVFEAAGVGEGGTETAFLEFAYGRSVRKLLADYTVELTDEEQREADEETEHVYRLKFVPREEEGRPAQFSAVEVVVADATWLPEELVLHESGGEIVHTYALSRVRTNTGMEDDDFDYEPPGNYTEWEPQEF